jgi:hypothetical protein
MKKTKHAFIEAMFPVKGGNIYKSATGEAASAQPAIARAFRALMKHVNGRRITEIKATITIHTPKEIN